LAQCEDELPLLKKRLLVKEREANALQQQLDGIRGGGIAAQGRGGAGGAGAVTTDRGNHVLWKSAGRYCPHCVVSLLNSPW